MTTFWGAFFGTLAALFLLAILAGGFNSGK